MYYVYIITNPQGKRYIRYTHNIAQRVAMHNDLSLEKAKFHRTTHKNGPWTLCYEMAFATRTEAMRHERFLKTGSGRTWLERARRDRQLKKDITFFV
jgi:predicted GIY-YIG superfamily endonuclease